MPILNTAEADIYYEVHGEGPPLLLIAGMASDSKSWQFILEAMKKHFTLILFDNRGCGRTVYREKFTLMTIADDAIKLLDFLGYDKVEAVGHSMGGMILQEIAIKYPERLKKIVFASSSPQLSDKAKSILDELSDMWAQGTDMAEWYRLMFQNLFTKKSLANKKFMDAAIIFALAYPYPQSQQGFNDQVYAITDFDKRELISKIMHNTLIMSGEEDILIPAEESKALCQIGGQSEFVMVEGAAHSIHAERPATFCDLLTKFLVNDN